MISDPKQRARWLLHEAREQILLGDYDAAEKKINEADAIDVKWGLFDDTPAKARTALAKARPKVEADVKTGEDRRSQDRQGQAQGGPRRAGRPPVRAGRGDRPARSRTGTCPTACSRTTPTRWPPPPGPFAGVTASATPPAREQASQGVYDILVSESRQLMKVGRLDDAESKARQAQRMNVVPSLTDDRAEAVLHDIAMNRAKARTPRPAIRP